MMDNEKFLDALATLLSHHASFKSIGLQLAGEQKGLRASSDVIFKEWAALRSAAGITGHIGIEETKDVLRRRLFPETWTPFKDVALQNG